MSTQQPSAFSAAIHIARAEWRLLKRTRVALMASLVIALLGAISASISYTQWQDSERQQSQYNQRNAQEFEAQPNRNPHRMAHFGQYLFRPPGPLAFFDFGIEDYAGSMVYLEAHRQNSANFSNARQSSALLRFGRLTPAFVLQTLMPLLIIFLAFGCVARERESGTLRLLLAQGISGRTQLLGKMAGQGSIVLLFAAPGLIAPLFLDGVNGTTLLMFGAYAIYLLFWVGAAVMVSALARNAKGALLLLITLWMTTVILLPRMASQIAGAAVPLPTRLETDILIHRDLKAIGDSHNPDDPYFSEFKARTLAHYGVQRIEDLPVDYTGLLLVEGERLTSELFAKYADQAAAIEDGQNTWVDRIGLSSPLQALRRVSMALAGSDLSAQRHFMGAVEAHRFTFVQGLNQLQAEHVKEAGERISRTHWAELPKFEYRAPDPLRGATTRLYPALAVLVTWLVVWLVAGFVLGRRIEGNVR
jgi:ABC-2 type transport system permease protein